MIKATAARMQKDAHLCFIGHIKAFDKAQHKDLFEQLRKLDLFEKDIRIILNIYWEQTTYIWIENGANTQKQKWA